MLFELLESFRAKDTLKPLTNSGFRTLPDTAPAKILALIMQTAMPGEDPKNLAGTMASYALEQCKQSFKHRDDVPKAVDELANSADKIFKDASSNTFADCLQATPENTELSSKLENLSKMMRIQLSLLLVRKQNQLMNTENTTAINQDELESKLKAFEEAFASFNKDNKSDIDQQIYNLAINIRLNFMQLCLAQGIANNYIPQTVNTAIIASLVDNEPAFASKFDKISGRTALLSSSLALLKYYKDKSVTPYPALIEQLDNARAELHEDLLQLSISPASFRTAKSVKLDEAELDTKQQQSLACVVTDLTNAYTGFAKDIIEKKLALYQIAHHLNPNNIIAANNLAIRQKYLAVYDLCDIEPDSTGDLTEAQLEDPTNRLKDDLSPELLQQYALKLEAASALLAANVKLNPVGVVALNERCHVLELLVQVYEKLGQRYKHADSAVKLQAAIQDYAQVLANVDVIAEADKEHVNALDEVNSKLAEFEYLSAAKPTEPKGKYNDSYFKEKFDRLSKYLNLNHEHQMTLRYSPYAYAKAKQVLMNSTKAVTDNPGRTAFCVLFGASVATAIALNSSPKNAGSHQTTEKLPQFKPGTPII